MTTATKTKVYVELSIPVVLELEVENTDTDTILNSVWEDLKNPNSKNSWTPDYDSCKDAVRGCDTAEQQDEQNFYLC